MTIYELQSDFGNVPVTVQVLKAKQGLTRTKLQDHKETHRSRKERGVMAKILKLSSSTGA